MEAANQRIVITTRDVGTSYTHVIFILGVSFSQTALGVFYENREMRTNGMEYGSVIVDRKKWRLWSLLLREDTG